MGICYCAELCEANSDAIWLSAFEPVHGAYVCTGSGSGSGAGAGSTASPNIPLLMRRVVRCNTNEQKQRCHAPHVRTAGAGATAFRRRTPKHC